MMRSTSALRQRDRRALVLGAVTLGLAFIARLTWPTITALRSVEEQNQLRADALARLASRPAVRELADSLQSLSLALDSARTALLPAGSGPAVASHLHSAVRRAASDVGLRVLESRAEADSGAADRFVTATVRLEAEGDVSNVMQFLLLLELAPGSLLLEELSLTPLEPTARDDRPESIRMAIAIEGIAPRRNAGSRQETP